MYQFDNKLTKMAARINDEKILNEKFMTGVIHSEITVKSTGRLHMGFFDLHGGLGRKYGSIGLSLNEPTIKLTATISSGHHTKKIEVMGGSSIPSIAIEKVLVIAEHFAEKLELSGGIRFNIIQHIPEHAGLGSGTQLSLAIGTAISQLYKLNLSLTEIAELSGRGARSGIGIAAFKYGGLLIDGGRASGVKQSTLKLPPLLARYDFPESWRILLILENNKPGIHGEEELVAFNKLPVFSENLAAHLCRHVLMQAMPALVENDLAAFGRSIQELQAHVGDYFSPAQGGRYASPHVGEVLKYLGLNGVDCFGQSSWGPTGFAVFESEVQAEAHLKQLKMIFKEPSLTWMICSAHNRGAEISMNNEKFD